MKAVMISIQPKWCELIANGEKTIEVRKTYPKECLEKYYEKQSDFFRERSSYRIKPFKCYIYCTVSGATKNCSENEKGRKNLLIDYCRDSILDDRQVITQDLKGRRQLGKHTTQAFNYGTVLNGKVIGEFVCDKIEKINSAVVPYSKTNNLGYERFLDNGVYKLRGTDLYHPNDGVVFERQDSSIGSMLNNVDFEQLHLTPQNVFNYMGGFGKTAYMWHISQLKIYDKPKELREFRKEGFMTEEDWHFALYPNTHCHYAAWAKKFEMSRPPQSWCYCEELEE